MPPTPPARARVLTRPPSGMRGARPVSSSGMLGSGQQRRADHRDEHQPDEGRQHLLEGAVAAGPHEGEADEARDDAPPRHRQHAGEPGEREAGAGHRGGAVDEAPDHDVGREVPRRPDAERAPALEDRPARGQRVAARALDQHDLHQAADDHAPQQRVAELLARDERGDEVGGADAGRRDDEAGADDAPAGDGGLLCRGGGRHGLHPRTGPDQLSRSVSDRALHAGEERQPPALLGVLDRRPATRGRNRRPRARRRGRARATAP